MEEQVRFLQERVQNMRADLMAQRMLIDAMLIAMTPNAREALQHNFLQLSERSIAGALANVQSEEGVQALQRAVDQTKQRLQHLPRSS